MVPGVTRRWLRRPLGSRRIRAAKIARSAQSKAWSRVGAAEHRDLVPQHEELDVLGRGRAPHQQDKSQHIWKIRYSSRSDMGAIMPNR